MILDSWKHVWVGICWTHANVSGRRMSSVSEDVTPLAEPPFLILIPLSMPIQNYSRFTPKKVLSIWFSIHFSLVGFIPSSTREHYHWRNHVSHRRACTYMQSSYQLTAGSLYICLCKSHTCRPGFMFSSCCFKSNIIHDICIHLKVNQPSKIINTTFHKPFRDCPSKVSLIFMNQWSMQ